MVWMEFGGSGVASFERLADRYLNFAPACLPVRLATGTLASER
jgi:hypothetical protein